MVKTIVQVGHIFLSLAKYCSAWSNIVQVGKVFFRFVKTFLQIGQVVFSLVKYCSAWSSIVQLGQILFRLVKTIDQPGQVLFSLTTQHDNSHKKAGAELCQAQGKLRIVGL